MWRHTWHDTLALSNIFWYNFHFGCRMQQNVKWASVRILCKIEWRYIIHSLCYQCKYIKAICFVKSYETIKKLKVWNLSTYHIAYNLHDTTVNALESASIGFGERPMQMGYKKSALYSAVALRNWRGSFWKVQRFNTLETYLSTIFVYITKVWWKTHNISSERA